MLTSSFFSRIASVLLVAVIAGGAFALPATAQRSDAPERSNTERLFLQVTLDGQALEYDRDAFADAEGGGLSLRAGWGVSRLVTLYIGVSGARVDSESGGVLNDEYDWGSGEIGARFNFRSGRAFVPYADVALQGVTARDDDLDLEFSGGGLVLGGGVSYFLSRSVALDAGLRFGGGEFNEVKLGRLSSEIDDDNFNYGAGRFSLGLTFYPLR